MDAKKAFSILMIQEGIKAVIIKGDSGGLTKYGIAEASHPGVDIANLTQPQAEQIYLYDYWVPAQCNKLKEELQYAHFSCAVNCGVGSAARILQRASRVKEDGIIGEATLNASLRISIQDYCIEWGLHYKDVEESHPEDLKFKKGWQNRIDYILTEFKKGNL